MSTDQGVETTRTTVKTYVPEYQRDEWDAHAAELDMSRSEFVKSMVQAGRRGFDPEVADGTSGSGSEDDSKDEAPETKEKDTDAAEFDDRILEALSSSEYLSWEELVDAVTSDIESDLETSLKDLQAKNAVRYSGPNGGYTLDE